MSIITLRTDGSCIPNPGAMGIGGIICKDREFITFSESKGNGTNNQAEYQALIRGLEEAKKIKKEGDEVVAIVDSQLIYRQIAGWYRVKNEELKPLHQRIKDLISEIGNVKIYWDTRETNDIADQLAKEAITRDVNIPKAIKEMIGEQNKKYKERGV